MATYITGVATESGSGTIVTSPALNVAAGDGLIFGVKHEGANTTITWSASAAQTIGDGTEVNHANGDLNGRMGYIVSANANAALTISANFGAAVTFAHIHVMQFRPAASTSFLFDIEPTPVASAGTTLATGAFSVAGAGAVGAFFGEYSAATYTVGSGWIDAVTGTTIAFSEYRLPSGAGSITANCTTSAGAMDYLAMAIALKEQSAGGSTQAPRSLQQFRMRRK